MSDRRKVITQLEYKRFERILCCIDFSEFSYWAYDQALAGRYRAKFFVQHVVETWRYPINYSRMTPDNYVQYCEKLVGEGRERLQNFVNSYPKNQIQIQSECLTELGTCADRIVSLAEERSVDLIVMGTHGWRRFDRLMMGSVSLKSSCTGSVFFNKLLVKNGRSISPMKMRSRPANRGSGSYQWQ